MMFGGGPCSHLSLLNEMSLFFIVDHVRSTREGTVFSRVCPRGGGEADIPHPYRPSQVGRGTIKKDQA